MRHKRRKDARTPWMGARRSRETTTTQKGRCSIGTANLPGRGLVRLSVVENRLRDVFPSQMSRRRCRIEVMNRITDVRSNGLDYECGRVISLRLRDRTEEYFNQVEARKILLRRYSVVRRVRKMERQEGVESAGIGTVENSPCGAMSRPSFFGRIRKWPAKGEVLGSRIRSLYEANAENLSEFIPDKIRWFIPWRVIIRQIPGNLDQIRSLCIRTTLK